MFWSFIGMYRAVGPRRAYRGQPHPARSKLEFLWRGRSGGLLRLSAPRPAPRGEPEVTFPVPATSFRRRTPRILKYFTWMVVRPTPVSVGPTGRMGKRAETGIKGRFWPLLQDLAPAGPWALPAPPGPGGRSSRQSSEQPGRETAWGRFRGVVPSTMLPSSEFSRAAFMTLRQESVNACPRVLTDLAILLSARGESWFKRTSLSFWTAKECFTWNFDSAGSLFWYIRVEI